MRLIILSFAALSIGATLYCTKPSNISTSDVQDKKVLSQLSEYEIFAQKYEATFGEKPSAQVWSRGKNGLKPDCSQCCGNGGGSGDGTSF